jgi:peptidoglycan-associated lipoprotein
MKRASAIFLLALLIINAFGNNSIDAANDAYAKQKYAVALAEYLKVIKKPTKDLNTGEVQFQLANCYRNLGKYDEALSRYTEAKKEGFTNGMYALYEGICYLKKDDYTKAQEKFQNYLAANPNDLVATRLLNNCVYGLNTASDTTIVIKNEKSINTIYNEFAASIIKDKVLFTSSRVTEEGEPIYSYDGEAFSDIYQVAYFKEDKLWSKATKLDVFNTTYNDGVVSYCLNTQTLYYTKCNNNKGKDDLCKIIQSVFDQQKNKWGEPSPIELDFEQKDDMQQPSVSADGATMYFGSKWEGGQGGSDIWVMKKTGSKWGAPVNAGKNINTELDELFPVVLDSALFFSSEGHLGYGGLDLFVSVSNNGTWGKAENLKAPYNSSGDDFAISLNTDIASGFISSNRAGGIGGDDIYSFYPNPISLLLRGTVAFDDNNQVPTGTKVILATDGRSDTVYIEKTNEYYFYLEQDKDYKLSVYRPGYFGESRRFTTKGLKKSMELSGKTGYEFSYRLKPITKDEVKLDNIYYDFGSVKLNDDSKASLDKLAKLLDDTPGATVQINSHTDEKGSYEVNMRVSEQRAKAIVDYMVAKGISKKRLSYKGWGFTQPVVKGATTEEDHQKNRRTTFQVLQHD